MSDQNSDKIKPAAAGGNTPIFRVQKMYVKDLSFENPNAPDVFLAKKGEPRVNVNLNIKNRKLKTEDIWEIVLLITATVTNSETEETLFVIEIEHAGVFLLKNIPEKHMNAVLAVECPALLFPFTRQIISQAAVDGGFIPFLMDPVNFLALYENSRKKESTDVNVQ